jgi:hypothetical protein
MIARSVRRSLIAPPSARKRLRPTKKASLMCSHETGEIGAQQSKEELQSFARAAA